MPGATQRRVGFAGLGAMGSRMARRLLDRGYPVVVYNRTPARAEPLRPAGAVLCDTPAAVAGHSDTVLYSLADDGAVRDVVLGAGGLLAGARAGTVFIDLSTVLPETSRAVSSAAGPKGVAVLDAPVSGSTPQVEQGALVIFVGGDRKVYEGQAPLLDVLGRHHYMGGHGAGTTMKLVANTLLGLGMEALAEATALGRKGGLDATVMLDTLAETSVVSPSQKSKFDNMMRGEYPPAFALRLMSKDFGLVLRLAESLSVAMPAAAAARQMDLVAQVRSGGREEDFSAVIRTLHELAGVPPDISPQI
ncbi:MAG TPA: NAD(P)-dependent oxidoreductase [bacterium]|nr:NAD(P)-dependent oxidoreductase [bacterium]